MKTRRIGGINKCGYNDVNWVFSDPILMTLFKRPTVQQNVSQFPFYIYKLCNPLSKKNHKSIPSHIAVSKHYITVDVPTSTLIPRDNKNTWRYPII